MFNGIVDILPHWIIDPFVGGGIGAVFPKYGHSSGVLIGPNALGFSQDEHIFGTPHVLGYQGIGGFSVRLNDRLNIDLTYRYLGIQYSGYFKPRSPAGRPPVRFSIEQTIRTSR